MKKLLLMILSLTMLCSHACATIIEPRGVDLEFKLSTGIEARRAVVLCRTLSARTDRKDNAKKLKTYTAGETFLTWESWDGWMNCYYSEGKDPAWVRNWYVVLDPAYYITDEQTAVYAYGDTTAPRVALLAKNEELPIIKETDEWCVVSLRGAAGWIKKTPKDTAHRFWFQPNMLQHIKRAELQWTNGLSVLTDRKSLAQLSALLTDARDMGAPIAGCVADVYLTLVTDADEKIVLELANDSCAIYRVEGRDYRYANSTHADNSQLYALFPEYTAPWTELSKP